MKKRRVFLIGGMAILLLATGVYLSFLPAKKIAVSSLSGENNSDSQPVKQEEPLKETETLSPESKPTSQTSDSSLSSVAETQLTEESPDNSNGSKTSENSNSSTKEEKIISRLVNFGFATSSGRTIDTIILHSSYNALGGDVYDVKKLVEEYKSYGVAPHYLIDRDGKIYQLVADKNLAYHAGESQTPDGRSQVNNFSIGIELMNTKTDKYTDKQYEAVNKLITILKNHYKIKYILGHKDIAPGRKDDPWGLEWGKVRR